MALQRHFHANSNGTDAGWVVDVFGEEWRVALGEERSSVDGMSMVAPIFNASLPLCSELA
jgi:hypothetical protein